MKFKTIPQYITVIQIIHFLFLNFSVNGSQLAKMKKSIPDMSLPWNL